MKHTIKFFLLASALLLTGAPTATAQPVPHPYEVALNYYLPSEWTYTLNPDITTPEQYLGFALGSQHADWAQVTGYFELLAKESGRFSLKTYGKTYENRPLICAAITSPQNQQNLEQIRLNHLTIKEGKEDKGPMIVLCGNTIHGNEPSGVQSALIVAYFMAAAEGADIDRMLNEQVLLLIPGFNPDGINRFASWVNTNRGLSNNSDTHSREFHETGPSSRYNHYWHDLNRDWLFLQHPETRFGVQVYQEWLPIVMSDHHEMGSSKSFYFSPGDMNRVHDQVPADNQSMTWEVAKYIEKNIQKIHSKYFTKRGYDDYYIGKGAAYGDVQGSLCLLTEQASSRGHYRMERGDLLTFPFTIRNTVTAEFAIIYAAWKEKERFQQYMLKFYQNLPHQQDAEGFLFAGSHSKATTWHFIHMLQEHHIKVCLVEKGLKGKEAKQAGDHFFIPFKGNNPALIHAIMDANLQHFGDSIFYDVSAWTLPLAYGLDYKQMDGKKLQLKEITSWEFPKGTVSGSATTTGGYTFPVSEFYAPAMMYALQNKGARLSVKEGLVYAETSRENILAEAQRTGVNVQTAPASLNKADFLPLRQPKVAIVGVNNGHATTLGSYWFLTDYRFQMAPSMLDASQLTTTDLSAYNTILMVDNPDEAQRLKLQEWVEQGGVLIGANVASATLRKMGMDALTEKKVTTHSAADRKSGFPGGILQICKKADSPLSWGIPSTQIPVFKMGTSQFKNTDNALFTFGETPLSGYFAKAYKESIAGTPAVVTKKLGKGELIYFNFSIAFRSTFFASTQLLSNAIYFGQFCR